jgi:hypothetical protein
MLAVGLAMLFIFARRRLPERPHRLSKSRAH